MSPGQADLLTGAIIGILSLAGGILIGLAIGEALR